MESTPTLGDTPSTSSTALKKAKNDYLNGPQPSTSTKGFKKPMQKSKSLSSVQDDSFSDEDNISVVSSIRAAYSRSEEIKILKWIAQHKRFSEVGGIAMWRVLEADHVLPGRSHQSMKERFRKHILPKIEVFDLDEDDLAAFKKQRNCKPSLKKKGGKK